MPTVLFGTEYWNQVFNPKAMAEWGTISYSDLELYFLTDSVDDAYDYLVKAILEAEEADEQDEPIWDSKKVEEHLSEYL